jgi:hypothetical protein
MFLHELIGPVGLVEKRDGGGAIPLCAEFM